MKNENDNKPMTYIIVLKHDKGSSKWKIYSHSGQFRVVTVNTKDLLRPAYQFNDKLTDQLRTQNINHGVVGEGISTTALKKYLTDYRKNYQL